MDAMECLLRRRTDEELFAVLEAGTYAPSARGKQTALIVAVQDPDTIALLSRINARLWDRTGIDPFYGAPTVAIVFADGRALNHVKDGSLVLGNMMNAAFALGLGSCWINRAKETFETEEGRALLEKWEIPDCYVGIGNCILGYPDCELPRPAARKEDFIRLVR